MAVPRWGRGGHKPPDTLAVFKGPTSRGREGWKGRGQAPKNILAYRTAPEFGAGNKTSTHSVVQYSRPAAGG